MAETTTKNGKRADLEVVEGGDERPAPLPASRRQVIVLQIPFTPLLGVRDGVAITQKLPAFRPEEGVLEIEPSEEGFLAAYDRLMERVEAYQAQIDAAAAEAPSEGGGDRTSRVRQGMRSGRK